MVEAGIKSVQGFANLGDDSFVAVNAQDEGGESAAIGQEIPVASSRDEKGHVNLNGIISGQLPFQKVANVVRRLRTFDLNPAVVIQQPVR